MQQPFTLGQRLNPCFSGGWSRSFYRKRYGFKTICLNPCFSGGWSRRATLPPPYLQKMQVLILVLVEDGLGDKK